MVLPAPALGPEELEPQPQYEAFELEAQGTDVHMISEEENLPGMENNVSVTVVKKIADSFLL